MGRVNKSIADHLHSFYLTKSSTRNAQNVTAQMIHWLWTHFLRPSWNDKNTFVHKHYRAEKSKRQLSDTLIEVEELYHNTDHDSLGYIDRQLLEADSCELRQRPQHQLDAWIMSIEAGIRSAAMSSAPLADPNQQHLSYTTHKVCTTLSYEAYIAL